MDKTLMVAKWFCENNNTVKTNSYDGNVLLNKLCYYSKAMFLALNNNIIRKDVEAWKNGPVLPFVYGKYRYDDLLNLRCEINLSDDELKVLKIINRIYGYFKATDISEHTHTEYPWNSLKDKVDKQLNPKITDESLIEEYKDEMLELYDCYKDEELNEKLEIINGRYFFISPDITLTEDEYSELSNAKYEDENVTYYVSRDSEGNLMVY